MKNIFFIILFFSSFSFSQKNNNTGEETLFLSMQKLNLGQLSDFEEKKKFLDTIQLEKQKIQYKMLENIYQNAYEFYKSGDYQSARDMSARILSIDPNFEDARILKEASENLRGSLNPSYSEKIMIDDKFKEALSLYQDGAVLSAYKKMNEVVKLSPNNIKAKYWLEKIRTDLKDYYIKQGEEEFQKNDLKSALNNFYSALKIKPKDEKIIYKISEIEEDLRNQMLNQKLKEALEVYAKGDIKNAYVMLQNAMQINPGDNKANKLFKEVKLEIENSFIETGKSLYSKRKYNSAISEWKKAMPYSSDITYLNKLISSANHQIKKEIEYKKKKEEEAIRKAKEKEEREKKLKEEEEKKKAMGQPTLQDEEAIKQNKITEQNKITANQHYLEGLKAFQDTNYQKAKDEWTIAQKLDPTNTDIEAGLKRIQQILGN